MQPQIRLAFRCAGRRHRADDQELQAAGKTSPRAIAEGLNAQGIPTARGEGEWTATQVMRVLERLDPFEAAA